MRREVEVKLYNANEYNVKSTQPFNDAYTTFSFHNGLENQFIVLHNYVYKLINIRNYTRKWHDNDYVSKYITLVQFNQTNIEQHK